jgi:hypothetical protein
LRCSYRRRTCDGAHDAALARKGITQASRKRLGEAADAYRYRSAVTRALRDIKTLPKLRGTSRFATLAARSVLGSYTSPRALALFSQLEMNLDYFETNRVPATRVDVADEDGVVYRWFPRLGLEFHPLANFGALNAAAAAGDVESTRTLADALLARGIPRGSRLIWEYQFRFGGGRPPWASGMAQAVATQALARASGLLQDPNLGAAAVRAWASVPPLLLPLPSGPWIRLYGFNSQVVLNAQLQTILSLLEYAVTSGDEEASALAEQLNASAQALFPRFDTGDWSRYQLGGAYATSEYQTFVTDLLAKLAKQTQDPFWVDAAQRFRAYVTVAPQVTPGPATPEVWPQPLDGYLDTAQIPITLSQRASVTLAVGGNVTTYKLAPGARVLTWTPPAALAPGNIRCRSRPPTTPEEADLQARADRRRLGHGAAADHRLALRHDADLAGRRTRHALACARRRLRRPDRRRSTADAGSRAAADERHDRAHRTGRNLAGDAQGDELRRADDDDFPRNHHTARIT